MLIRLTHRAFQEQTLLEHIATAKGWAYSSFLLCGGDDDSVTVTTDVVTTYLSDADASQRGWRATQFRPVRSA